MSLTLLAPATHRFEGQSFSRGHIILPPMPSDYTPIKTDGTVAPPPTPQPASEQIQLKRDGRLIIVSNRLPITIKRQEGGQYQVNKSSGGLVTGLSGLDQEADHTWYGWLGQSVPADDSKELQSRLKEQHKAIAVTLDDDLAESHYNGFSSMCTTPDPLFFQLTSHPSDSTLWPLLHYQGCFSFSRGDWKAYEEVNQIFSARLAADCEDGDIVWIHDYHLLLVPELLRKQAALLNKKITIGFFLHTPFPASDQFKILPVCEELLQGVLGSDMVGFHTASYAENFKSTCADVL
jgi:trehalose 6-phosphate synthase